MGDGDLNKAKILFHYYHTEQRRGESHGKVEEPGIELKALGLSPSSATSLAVYKASHMYSGGNMSQSCCKYH